MSQATERRSTIDFGIDLGTTNSSIAVIEGVGARVIPNRFGSGTTPSAVWIDKRGHLHVGEEAKKRASTSDRENGSLEFKQSMGRGESAKKRFARSGREMTPEELSAEVLKALRLDVQTTMGEEFRAAVITVPAAFENPMTTATRRAAELAGITVSPLLLEPVAASLAYGFQSESENVYWFVYDFGGGTFDAAVMRIRDGLIQVVNYEGDNNLGGKLIDWDIVDKKLCPAVAEQFGLSDFKRGGDPRWANAIFRLKYGAEQAKIEVCRTRAPFEMWVEGLREDGGQRAFDFAYTLTPSDLEEVSRPHIERSLNLCRKTLEGKGLKGSDMERVLLVGGTSLSPWVRDAVRAELGDQVEYGIDPVTVVARGAAIFASTQTAPDIDAEAVPVGTWRVQVEHRPVGNVLDPDIGGRVVPPNGQALEGFTIELVDSRTQWTSGRVPLTSDGVFMTQLYAEKLRRHEFDIVLCDASGTRIPTSPDGVTYTIGVIPEEHPPAALSIGVGLANGSVAPYIRKGTPLPARKTLDHYSVVPLRAGHAEDEVRIPLVEGEHPRAKRNHNVGEVVIRGTDVKRDLPAGSPIEITLLMDASQQVRAQVFLNTENEDVADVEFNPVRDHEDLSELREQARQEEERLAGLREQAGRTAALKAQAAITRIEEEQLLGHVGALLEAAGTDPDVVMELDRRLRDLAAKVDDVEDAVEWPTLLEKVEVSREDAAGVVEQYGEARDRSRLRTLTEELERAIDRGDADLLRRYVEELDALYFRVLERQPGFHVHRFEVLVEKAPVMRDPQQAEQIIAQGRRARDRGDVDALKAANRQLISLLPQREQDEVKHPNEGDIMMRG